MNAILACDYNGGIGKNGKLPWSPEDAPGDLAYFKKVTNSKTIIMGSKTWDSLPFRPLRGRLNVILTSRTDIESSDSVKVFNNKDSLMEFIDSQNPEDIFIIGGATVFNLLLTNIKKIYLTLIRKIFDCDTIIPLNHLLTDYHITVIHNDTKTSRFILETKS